MLMKKLRNILKRKKKGNSVELEAKEGERTGEGMTEEDPESIMTKIGISLTTNTTTEVIGEVASRKKDSIGNPERPNFNRRMKRNKRNCSKVQLVKNQHSSTLRNKVALRKNLKGKKRALGRCMRLPRMRNHRLEL